MRILLTIGAFAAAASLGAACKPKSHEPAPVAAGAGATGAQPLANAPKAPGAVDPNAKLPPGHPPIGATEYPPGSGKVGVPNPMGTPGAPGTPTEGAQLHFKPAKSWIVKPPASKMRVAQYTLLGTGSSGEAELVVFHFPGMGGGIDDNIKRWHAQFKQEAGGPPPSTKTTTINGLKVTTTRISGTYAKPRDPAGMGGPTDDVPKQAMWAAIVETRNGPWFFKAIGPVDTIAAHAGELKAFTSSFRL